MARRFAKWVLRLVCTWFVKRSCHSYVGPIRANFPTFVTANTALGRNVNFNGLCVKGRGRVTIGDNFHSGKGVMILTDNHKYDGGRAIPYDPVDYVVKDVVIGDNVWLGDRVIVLGGVTIAEGAIIQAGSVVVKSIPKCAIAGGHPARVFKYRDIDRYERLKHEGKFH